MKKLVDLMPGATWAKVAIYAVLGLLLGFLLYQGVYRLFFQGQDLARERGDRIVAEEQNVAEGAIVDNAMGAIHDREVYREHITTIVRDSKKEIDNAWHGETVGDDVDRAGADALCRLHDSLCRPAAAEAVQPVR